MPFGRIHEEAAGDSKLLALSDAAFRMWTMGLVYCQKNLSDGFIDDHAIAFFGVREKSVQRVAEELCREQVRGRAPLWSRVEGGYQIHDYLQWNDAKEQVLAAREIGKTRRQLYADQDLLNAVRDRDGCWCRYCGRDVNWKDRRGPAGATYDHVDPRGGNSVENLVVACRGCNSSKGPKTLDECGMQLLQPRTQVQSKSGSSSVLENAQGGASGTWYVDLKKEKSKDPSALAGSLPREHLHHAVCDDTFARCVPAAVENKLASLLAPRYRGDLPAARADLRRWYPTVWHSLAADFVMGDAFKFWQGRFDATFASKDAVGRRPEPVSNVPSADRTAAYLREQRQM